MHARAALRDVMPRHTSDAAWAMTLRAHIGWGPAGEG